MPALADTMENNKPFNPPSGSVNIVVVDDDCDDSGLIVEGVQEISESYKVTAVDKPEKLICFLDSLRSEELPRLILIDYSMPKLTGYDLLKELKQHVSYKHIPVVVYSHSNFYKHKLECIAAGAAAFITKSNSMSELKADILKMLSYCS